MSSKKNKIREIRLLHLAADEAYKAGDLSSTAYRNLLNDLEQQLINIDTAAVTNDFKELIKNYQIKTD